MLQHGQIERSPWRHLPNQWSPFPRRVIFSFSKQTFSVELFHLDDLGCRLVKQLFFTGQISYNRTNEWTKCPSKMLFCYNSNNNWGRQIVESTCIEWSCGTGLIADWTIRSTLSKYDTLFLSFIYFCWKVCKLCCKLISFRTVVLSLGMQLNSTQEWVSNEPTIGIITAESMAISGGQAKHKHKRLTTLEFIIRLCVHCPLAQCTSNIIY